MKMFWALYVKEWKDSRYLFGVVGIGLVALEVYGWYAFDPDFLGGAKKEAFFNHTPFFLATAASFLAPAFMLARAFSSEWKTETHYQWFSLPVHRWVSVVCKLAVAFCQGILFMVFAIANMLALDFMYSDRSFVSGLFSNIGKTTFVEKTVLGIDIFVVFVIPVLLYFLLCLSLVTALEGVKFAFHKYQGLIALVFFGLMVYIYARFYKTAMYVFDFLGSYKPWSFWDSGSMKGGMEIGIYAYPVLMITLLMALGLWLFHKRVEI